MERLKCAVKGCERGALLLFGNKWICGEHFLQIREKELQKQNKLVEELENGN